MRRVADRLSPVLAAVFCLLPFYWMVASSLRRTNDMFDMSVWPNPMSLENYRAVFKPGHGFVRSLGNSLVVAGSTTVLTLIIGVSAAYALARLRFRFKRAVLALVVSTSMFPGSLLIVPLLKLFTDIGWINSYQAMVVPSLSFALPLAVWNLTAFFRRLPFELEQAAMVDGCTAGQAFRKIILPLAAPGVFTTAILVFLYCWSDFVFAISLTSTNNARTVPAAIAFFTGASQFQQPTGSIAAAAVIITIPVAIVVLLFQRRIVAGLTAGAVKG